MQLSRRGWNNVIIFSMLIMIFFLNGLHKNLGSDDAVASFHPVLPLHSFVLTLSFDQQKIERIGTSWRTNTPTPSTVTDWQGTEVQINTLVSMWQRIDLKLVFEKNLVDLVAPVTAATFYLAGEPLPWVYLLYREGEQFYLRDKTTQRVFNLDLVTAQALFPYFDFKMRVE